MTDRLPYYIERLSKNDFLIVEAQAFYSWKVSLPAKLAEDCRRIMLAADSMNDSLKKFTQHSMSEIELEEALAKIVDQFPKTRASGNRRANRKIKANEREE